MSDFENANFIKPKMTAIETATSPSSWRRQKSRYQYSSLIFDFSQHYSQKCKFHKTEDGGHRSCQLVVVQETPNVKIPVRFFELWLFAIFHQKSPISFNLCLYGSNIAQMEGLWWSGGGSSHGGHYLPARVLRPQESSYIWIYERLCVIFREPSVSNNQNIMYALTRISADVNRR